MGAGKGGACSRAQGSTGAAVRAACLQRAAGIDPARPFGGVFLPLFALYSLHIHRDVETQSAMQSRNEEICR